MCLWEPVLILLDEEQCLKIVGLAALYESTTLHPKTLRSRFSGESRKSGGPCKPDTDCMAYLTLRAFLIINIVCDGSLYRMVSRRGLFQEYLAVVGKYPYLIFEPSVPNIYDISQKIPARYARELGKYSRYVSDTSYLAAAAPAPPIKK